MPEQRTCQGCGKVYWWPGARWQHEQCKPSPNVATNTVATNKPATNKERTANRRDRASYNTYQRDYMKRKRAGKAGKAP